MATTTMAFTSNEVKQQRPPTHPSLRLFRTLHLWIGLSFGVLLVAQGLSGSALVWRPELDRLLLPALTQTRENARIPENFAHLEQEHEAVLRAVPGATLRAVRLPAATNGTDEWMVQPAGNPAAAGKRGGPRWTVYTSPVTGQVLGIRGQHRDALQWLIELHHTLLLGPFGRSLQGVLAIATVVLALSGLWLWWPRRFTWSRVQPRAAARPLHNALGFWFMWPLLVIAATATYFTWRQPMQHLLGVPAKGEGSMSSAAKPGAVSQTHDHGGHRAHAASPSLDAQAATADLAVVLQAAQAAAPGARFTMLRLPEGHNPFVVLFEDTAEHYRDAPNSLTLRPMPGGAVQVVRRSLWRDLSARQRFLEWLPRIHQGEIGGIPLRILWCVTGWIPAVLYCSGFLMWRRRLEVERKGDLRPRPGAQQRAQLPYGT